MKINRQADVPLDDLAEARRRFLVRALSLGFLTGGSGWNRPALASLFGKLPGRLPEGRSIFELRGTVLVNGQRATERTKIQPTDTVKTGDNSHVIYAVGTNAYLLRERSVLEFRGNPAKQALRLVTGKLLGVFGTLGAQRSLSLHTANATIGIRGTGAYAESDPGRTYLCTCYGSTELVAAPDYAPGAALGKGTAKPEKVQVTARHHDAPKYILSQPEKGKRIVPAPFINHTDLELMTLEALVGRQVPFGLPDREYEGPRREY